MNLMSKENHQWPSLTTEKHSHLMARVTAPHTARVAAMLLTLPVTGGHVLTAVSGSSWPARPHSQPAPALPTAALSSPPIHTWVATETAHPACHGDEAGWACDPGGQ